MTDAEPGMSFLKNLSSVPNLVYAGKNQWMPFSKNKLAVPKPAIHCPNPWMANSQKRASVPKPCLLVTSGVVFHLTLRFVNANVSLAVIEYHYVEVLGRRKRKFSPKEQHSQVPAQRAATKNGCSSGESRMRVPKVQGRICRISQVKGQGSEAVNGR